MKNLEVLVTGGAGFIGYHLSKHLASHGYDVTILDNLIRGQEDEELKSLNKDHNVHFIKADITKPETLEGLEKSFDYVYHLAAINGTGNFYSIPDQVIKVGILGTINILDWFVKQKKGKLLFSSSSETYAGALKLLGDRFPIPTPEEVPLVVDDPSNVRWSYGASKILSEVAIHSYSKVFDTNKFCIVRYHNIYGPRMGHDHVIPQFIEKILKKENPFKIFGGNETRTFCFIDDGVRATKLVMESQETNGKTINIGRDDEEIKIIDLANKLFDIADYRPRIEINPSLPGSVMRRCPDISKLNRLGYKQKFDLNEGLEFTYEYYNKKFHKDGNSL